MFTKHEDLTNRIFNRLTVTKKIRLHRRLAWLCECACGNAVKAYRYDLIRGGVKSCGCLQKEEAYKRCMERNVTHNMSKHSLYATWSNMISRCENKENPAYKNYGGRGIKVCDRWHNIENFIFDMSPKPSPELTLERIDNNGNYEKLNCKWATWDEQTINKRARNG